MTKISKIALNSLLIVIVHSLTTIPTFNITDKYIQTGTFTVSTAQYFGNTSWVGVKQTTFDMPYLRTHNNNYRMSIVFQDIDFLLTASYQLNISVVGCNYFYSKLTTCLSSTNIDNIKAVKQRYLILDQGFSKLSFYSLYIYGNPTMFINSSKPYSGLFGLYPENINGTVRAFVAFNGLNITAPDSNLQVDLRAKATFMSTTLIKVNLQTSLSKNLTLNGVFMCLIGYSEQNVAAWPFPAARLNYATFSATNGGIATYTDSAQLTRSYNTFWGLTRLNFNNQPSIKFTSSINPMVSVNGTSSVAFNNLDFTIVIFEFKECDPSTPYYMLATDICHDICPARYYGDSQFLCQTCPLSKYDCYQCNSTGFCTTCSNSTDFRVMNLSTSRCDPIPGYYDDGSNNSTAKPCDTNCETCKTNPTNCISCNSNFYLSSNKCFPCIANCQVCTSNTSCDTCGQNYAFDSGTSVCVLAINCSAIANCTTCNSTNGCTQCVFGYNFINITACSPACGDGIKLASEDCDNGNIGNGCYSNCTIQPAHFCVINGTGSVCNNCSLHCAQCTALSNCSSCQSPYILYNNTLSCVLDCSSIQFCTLCHQSFNQIICDACTLGYYPSNNTLNSTCQPRCGDGVIAGEKCDDGNKIDGDGCSSSCDFQTNGVCNIIANKSICSICSSKKYADSNHSVCLDCTYDCATCDSNGCLSCNFLMHRKLNNSTKRCVPLGGFHDDNINQLALPCSPECKTCNGSTANDCLSCENNKMLTSNNSCIMCSLIAGVGCNSCGTNSSTGSTNCFDCSFELQNGTCVALPNLPENQLLKLLLMVLLPLLLVLCCCCLILFCIWRRRKNQQNKVQQQEDGQKKLENVQKQNKTYKVDSKNLDGKILINETEGNDLSMNEFRQIGDIKANQLHIVLPSPTSPPPPPKQKSQVNYDLRQKSDASDFSQSGKEQDEQDSRGCHY